MAPHLQVVLIEDYPIVREGVRRYLEASGMKVVREAASGQEGIAAVIEHAPNVAIVDLFLPDLPGVEVIKELALNAPGTRILVLTVSEAERDIVHSIRAGATGYVNKDASSAEIVEAVQRVAQGEAVISSRVAAGLVEVIRDGQALTEQAEAAERKVRARLTPRELRVLELVADGLDNTEIGKELHISPYTVKNHMASILAKLHLENRVQAAVYAVRVGIA